jgi:hypothetical protein
LVHLLSERKQNVLIWSAYCRNCLNCLLFYRHDISVILRFFLLFFDLFFLLLSSYSSLHISLPILLFLYLNCLLYCRHAKFQLGKKSTTAFIIQKSNCRWHCEPTFFLSWAFNKEKSLHTLLFNLSISKHSVSYPWSV